MTKQYTCPAEKLLEMSGIIVVDDTYLSSWNLEAFGNGDEEIVLDFSYTDDEGLIFEFEFTEKALKEAKIDGHFISAIDNAGDLVEIACYNLVPNVI